MAKHEGEKKFTYRVKILAQNCVSYQTEIHGTETVKRSILPFSCEIQILSGIMSKPGISLSPKFACIFHANNPVKTI